MLQLILVSVLFFKKMDDHCLFSSTDTSINVSEQGIASQTK